MNTRRGARAALFALFASALAGCGGGGPDVVPPPTPKVTVSPVVERKVTESDSYTGRTQAVETVQVRSRITGFLDKIAFKEGTEVQKDQVLFEIDPRQLKADLEKAEGDLKRANFRSDNLKEDLSRAQKLLPTRAITEERYLEIRTQLMEAESAKYSAEAVVARAKVDLGFTEIKARIAGRIGRSSLTEGNLVGTDTVLTTIESVDPMYVYFHVSERALLRYQKMAGEESPKEGETDIEKLQIPVLLTLANGDAYPHKGVIDFAENTLDRSTGTLEVRARFPNPQPRKLVPGMSVDAHVQARDPRPAVQVADEAIATDQGGKFVYVVEDGDVVKSRKVTLGPVIDGLRVIEDGLKPGEKVIVNGLLRVRPEMKVEPVVEPMPGLPPTPEE